MTRRRVPVLAILGRLGWQPDPDGWSIRCRDLTGRRMRVEVSVTARGVALTTTRPGGYVLKPLQVGRLRAALRDAAFAHARLGGIDADPTAGKDSDAHHHMVA
jgi:hypothetical protein